jgi:TonB family protein
MPEHEESRILRIGVVREGHLVQERRFRKAEDVVVGRSKRCTLPLPGDQGPEAFRLFAYENGEYFLRFDASMTGTLSLDDAVTGLEAVKDSGKAARQGDQWVLPLRERDRGKVIIGDIELLFQLIVPKKQTRRGALRREGDWGNPLVERLWGLLWRPKHGGGAGGAPESREKKVLRVGVVREDQILQEKLLRRPTDVTVGRGSKCTLNLPVHNAPESYRMFVFRQGRFYLRFTSGMAGKVSAGDGVQDLQQVRDSGRAERNGEYYLLPLGEADRGKLVLGDVSLLFQFVVPPRPVAAEELAAARGGFKAAIERTRVWASLASTGSQSRSVQIGLWLGFAGSLLVLASGFFMPWLEEYTVDIARAGWSTSKLRAYGWTPGIVLMAAAAVSGLFGLLGLLRATKKLFSTFAILSTVVALAFVLLTPFVIRGSIRALIAAGTLIPQTQLSTDFGYQVAFVGVGLMLIGFIWGVVAQPVFGPGDRVLRLLELWKGTPIREQVFQEKRDVTVGIGGRADFVLPIRGGKPIRLFRVDRHGDYWLALLEGMTGSLSLDNEVHEVAEAARQEGARVGGTSYVQAMPGDWGNLEFGKVSLKFQFVPPPKTMIGRRRAMAMDGTLIGTFISSAFAVGVLYVISLFMWDPAGQMEQRKGEKRLMKVDVSILQEKDEKKLAVGEAAEGDAKEAEGKFGDAEMELAEEDAKKAKKGPARELTDEERRAKQAAKVKSETILRFLDGPGGGAGGPGGRALTAVTGMQDAWNMSSNSMAVYQEGGSSVGLAAGGGGRFKSAGMSATPGGGIGKLSAADIKGTGKVRIAAVSGTAEEKQEETVQIRVSSSTGGISGGKIDSASLASVFRRRAGAVKTCYEKALKINQQTAGKVTVKITISPGGTVTDCTISDNTTGDSGIGSCVCEKVRAWPFPTPEEGSVVVFQTFVLATGG